MSAPRIIGLDLSLTSIGMATPHHLVTIEPGKRTAEERLVYLRTEVFRYVDDADLVVVEGYAFGQPRGSSHSHALGELGGVIKVALYQRGIPFVSVAPASLKKYATGAGGGKGAKKEQVLIQAVRRFPDLAVGGNDQADSLWLRAMAMDHYGHPLVQMPATNREALAKVAWPDLGPRYREEVIGIEGGAGGSDQREEGRLGGGSLERSVRGDHPAGRGVDRFGPSGFSGPGRPPSHDHA